MLRFLVAVLTLVTCTERYGIAKGESGNEFTLDSVRASLVRQEDTIVFGVIERARFPLNFPTYHQNYTSIPDFCGSLLDFIVQHTEAIQAKAGRYINPEENPYAENLPLPVVPHYTFSQFLHPAAALININKRIRKMYFHEMLPLFVASGDDGNYAQTAASDLSLLQAISRRIHYGKFVAEAKFRESPQDYKPLIRAQVIVEDRELLFRRAALFVIGVSSNFQALIHRKVVIAFYAMIFFVKNERVNGLFLQEREALMRLLTSESIEEMVRKRVEKKAMVFGQEVSLDRHVKGKYKVVPSVVSRLYQKWIIPLTKIVEVEYLLRRLD